MLGPRKGLGQNAVDVGYSLVHMIVQNLVVVFACVREFLDAIGQTSPNGVFAFGTALPQPLFVDSGRGGEEENRHGIRAGRMYLRVSLGIDIEDDPGAALPVRLNLATERAVIVIDHLRVFEEAPRLKLLLELG